MRDRPNILLIYTDQQRFDTIRALGAEWMITPNLDRLCNEGIAYTEATTPSPVCMPARWSLHTGLWPSGHRCFSNHHPGPRPSYSLPGILRAGGYRTALIGKNHSYLSADEFDEFDTAPERSAARSAAEPALRARERAVEEDGDGRLYPKAAPGGRAGDPETYKTDAALRFLSDDDERPFFLWLSYLNPHTPYVAAERWFDVYRDRPVPEPAVEAEGLAAAGKPFRQIYHQENNDAILPFDRETTMTMRRVYYAMVSVIDEEIGRILEYLDKSGRREDTLIVFTSDHGDYMGDHGLLTKSPALYDCLVRVPFILSYPGVLPSGERRDDFVSHVDLLPTLAALSGCSVPAAVHGRDFLKYSGDELRPVAYAEYGIPGRPYDQWSYRQSGYVGRPFRNPGDDRLPWEGNPVSLSGRIRMIRSHRHKLVIEEEGTNELYDLENDPDELVNLASDPAHRGICTELLSSAEPILARLGDAVS